ncbi:hypothetical protein CCACVL1_17429, partial [Corchorus capsularis]
MAMLLGRNKASPVTLQPSHQ